MDKTKYSNQEINSISKDMKYEALYWALGFEECDKGIFKKEYDCNLTITINSDEQCVYFENKITILKSSLLILNSHKSFVVLECIDKLLTMGYKPTEIIIDLDNEYDIYLSNIFIKCYEWNHIEKDPNKVKASNVYFVTYSSRLVSGIIEREVIAKDNTNKEYRYGIFDLCKKQDNYFLYNLQTIESKDFEIEGTLVKKYIGNNKRVIVPNGIKELATCLFWDNLDIEEVVLPESLISISGDTFYNCNNLKKVNIPKNVIKMGNNPFAGCPNLELVNESSEFIYENGGLYSKDYYKIYYYNAKNSNKEYKIKDGCKIVGKHCFYLCNNLEKIIIPSSVIKLENNPFSGCEKLELENYSANYKVIDKVIYDKELTSVIGCINSIDTDCLLLKDVKRICRNSFWNCKGIRKIILPETLEKIGYNPFVGCSNIEFVSKTKYYEVYNSALYESGKERLICYPNKFVNGVVNLPDEVITLERGAFSGCANLEEINLHNTSIISKSCFTNCNKLKAVYCSDLVSYIGEWAFAHCENLREISVYKECFIDKNVISNSNAKISIRDKRTNYVIESDNLYTLKSLNKNYKNKVKAILIDPPYNSKIDGIGYKDDFCFDYNSFLNERIVLSYDLLSNDGFLVINIDEGEVKNLKNLCSKTFKDVKVCKWEKLHPYFDTNRNVNPNKKIVKYEYIIICSKSNMSELNKIKQPYIEDNKLKEYEREVPKIFSCFGTNSSAKDEIESLFGRRDYFSTPKPLKLMKELVRATTDKDCIVIDFFAGSGTIGHAVVDLNNEDGGSRNYILVSNSESNICRDVTLKRMQMFDDKVRFIY